MDIVTTYQAIRSRLIDLAADLSAEDLATTVPPTPAWSVKDTYAHIIGACTDSVTGNKDGVGTDAWTAAHVTARRDVAMEAMLEEWRSRADAFDALLVSSPETTERTVAGSWTHEQDIRGAVGLKGIRGSNGIEAVLLGMDRVAERFEAASVPGLTIHAGTHTWTLGRGDVIAELEADPYELARVISSRRNADQMAAMRWTGDPAPFLPHLGHYGLPTVHFEE